jgi:hypothetical protein
LTGPGDGDLAGLADRLAAALANEPRRRIPLERLWQVHATTDPGAVGGPVRRQRLAGALSLLAAQGVLQPAATNDRRSPPLPRFVDLTRPARPARPPAPTLAWHHRLSWVASADLSPAQLEVCKRVNRFLQGGGEDRPVIPVRERSYQLFDGDEKRLDALLASALFRAPGRLTLQLLRCQPSVAPLAYQRVGPGPGALVAENTATFQSLVRVIGEHHGAGPVGLVVFGEGRHFDASAPYLGQLDRPPTPVWYFGDLDAKGLATPQLANQRLAAAGLASVRPAAALYRLLLARARPAAVPHPPAATAVAELVAWLPADLRELAAKILSGHRLAQEAVGYEQLRDVAAWLDATLLNASLLNGNI